MSIDFIREYQKELAQLRQSSGVNHELALRPAFQHCLEKFCRLKKDRTLVPELRYSARAIPDGTIKDTLRMSLGYWEAKDAQDDIDREITAKTARGYPQSNIVYENTLTAVLIQDGEETMRADMRDDKALLKLITSFFAYEPPALATFRQAVEQFTHDLPDVVGALRAMIDESQRTKPAFVEAMNAFLESVAKAVDRSISRNDVHDMLIQHILTKDIFLKVFDDAQFHRENNIAMQLDKLEDTFFTGNTRRETVDKLKGYYSAITIAAAGINSHHEKQQFLKGVYEQFYKAYDAKAADRLGVVYTPNEIVSFMIRAADALVRKHFGRHIYDNDVQILDPATGTGTFITELIDFIPPAHLEYKYANEIHANEVAILPYYIANLNIEYTYKQKSGKYLEFPNICFVDTLDNVTFAGGPKGRQQTMLGGLSAENLMRVNRQNKEEISVIIGNPPYNANQRSYSDNNPNLEYPDIDGRIQDTYVRHSTAQKTKQYDMYKRFIRWASDRLHNNGVLAFITNRAYLDSAQDDGFRKVVLDEFNEIYIVDLGGDIRKTPGAQNVFGIKTGVAIGFFVRKENKTACDIFYSKPDEFTPASEKLAYLNNARFTDIDFLHIVPDRHNRWLDQTRNGFDSLLCIADKDTKQAEVEDQHKDKAVFKLFALGASTNRDDWVYDFDLTNLRQKVGFFAKTYNSFLGNGNQLQNDIIKWSGSLVDKFNRSERIKVAKTMFAESLYRPFTKKFYFADTAMSDRLTANHHAMFGVHLNLKNKMICFNAMGNSFYALGADALADLHFCSDTQCLPLYRYDEKGKRISNITEWGLKQFRDHYADKKITAESVFHYTYAVLHNPAYLKKYAINLQQEFPRLPYYKNFHQWAKWGNQLMTLHCDYEKQTAHPLARIDCDNEPGRTKLKADKPAGVITLDEQTKLTGIPPEAWQYRLGRRSALEWVLDQYKEKKIKDPTIAAKFNNYRFADHKEAVVELLGRVCAVSVATMKIVAEMTQVDE